MGGIVDWSTLWGFTVVTPMDTHITTTMDTREIEMLRIEALRWGELKVIDRCDKALKGDTRALNRLRKDFG